MSLKNSLNADRFVISFGEHKGQLLSDFSFQELLQFKKRLQAMSCRSIDAEEALLATDILLTKLNPPPKKVSRPEVSHREKRAKKIQSAIERRERYNERRKRVGYHCRCGRVYRLRWHKISHLGIIKNAEAWARFLDIPTKNLRWRLQNGWSVHDALTKPVLEREK